jgi:formate hydrogenlyase subunit 6/NADH:ubiquinone oxidoreductase subunit I
MSQAASAAWLVNYANSFVRRARIKIEPGEIPAKDRFSKVEKYPREFDIDMIRCIFCGMCEEVCPEQAIFCAKITRLPANARRDGARQGEVA